MRQAIKSSVIWKDFWRSAVRKLASRNKWFDGYDTNLPCWHTHFGINLTCVQKKRVWLLSFKRKEKGIYGNFSATITLQWRTNIENLNVKIILISNTDSSYENRSEEHLEERRAALELYLNSLLTKLVSIHNIIKKFNLLRS